LGVHRIGPSDLLPLWQSRVFSDEGAFLRSVEHIGWYLRSSDAASLKQPKGWVLKTLGRGYYAEPSGFQSLEEQQHAAQMADHQKRLDQARARAFAEFESEFELWRLENDMTKYSHRLHGAKPNGEAGKAMLRQVFSEETGREIPNESMKVA
jgi:hypothetical protein